MKFGTLKIRDNFRFGLHPVTKSLTGSHIPVISWCRYKYMLTGQKCDFHNPFDLNELRVETLAPFLVLPRSETDRNLII